MSGPARLWTTAEVAEYLQVPVATIHQWHHRGSGPTAIKVGRHLRFRPGDVDRWLDGLEGAMTDRLPLRKVPLGESDAFIAMTARLAAEVFKTAGWQWYTGTSDCVIPDAARLALALAAPRRGASEPRRNRRRGQMYGRDRVD